VLSRLLYVLGDWENAGITRAARGAHCIVERGVFIIAKEQLFECKVLNTSTVGVAVSLIQLLVPLAIECEEAI
jgi:hypothetical protein